METNEAVLALSALAQETRLKIFRLLVREGPSGLTAGRIADSLQVSPATLSFHLAQLERAGLLRSHRESRWIYYAPAYERMRDLLGFLTKDCCQGLPEICEGLAGEEAGGSAENREPGRKARK